MAEQEVIIEEAQPSDAKALIDLLNQVNAETDFIILEKNLSLDDMQTFLQTRAEVLNEICLVVRVGSELAGVLNIVSTNSPQLIILEIFSLHCKKNIGDTGLVRF